MFAQGCEWRIDHRTGEARCLGVVTREPMEIARYGVGQNGHAYLVIGNSESPAKIFERLGDGDYKLRARAFYADEHGAETQLANAGFPPRIMYWADENGDGKVQSNEVHPGVLGNNFTANKPIVATQDLTLQLTMGSGCPISTLRSVKGWTPCGAPLYGEQEGFVNAELWHASPDRQRAVSTFFGDFVCTDAYSHAAFWRISLQDFKRSLYSPIKNREWPSLIGSAVLPKPLGSVWLASQNDRPWHLISEDGFDLARFFGGDLAKDPLPITATPGIDMTHAVASREGSITQTADGKLYAVAGNSAYWNLEVTGLDKVKALPGGNIALPPAK
jgi:hypothetical protein